MSPARSMLWLFGIITICALIASIWLIRVPFYEEPDEIAHVDYIFQLFDVGRPFRIAGRNPHGEVAPQTRYLVRAVRYRAMRYDPYARAPAGYGTAGFFARLDAGAPVRSGKTPGAAAAVPYLMYSYPPEYYGIEAGVLTATYALSGSLSDGFFAMRAFNVLLLVGTLFLSYLSFRAYGNPERTSLLAVFAIGAFPLVSRVSSYVQPDNASTFLIAAVVYAVARGRRDRSGVADLVALGAIALLFLVKPHYAFAAWIVTVPLLTFKRSGRAAHPAVRVALGVLPLLVFAVSNGYLNLVSGIESPLTWVSRTHGMMSGANATNVGPYRLFLDALAEYLSGSVFIGFWLAFGFRGGRIFPEASAVPVFRVVTILGIASFLMAERMLLRHVYGVAKTFGRWAAVRLILADHPLNLYLVTTATLFTAHVLSGGALELEGRYWLPMLLPLALITLRSIPRPLPARVRRTTACVLAAGMAAYSLVASAAAVRAMNDDFYGRRPPLREGVADLIGLRSAGGDSTDSHVLDLPYPQRVAITGYAIDMLSGFAAKNVYVEVDDRARIAATSVALPYPHIAQIYNDDQVAATRFRVDVPARSLDAGKHRLRFFVGNVARADGIPFWADAFIVVARGSRR